MKSTTTQQDVALAGQLATKVLVDEAPRPSRQANSQTERASKDSMKVADSVHGAKEAMTVGKERVFRIDRAKQSELKQAIANGTYWLSSREIAERILSDTFGG
jgi:anti-sigma28 factor (negative regulator of flagellin synthesis)